MTDKEQIIIDGVNVYGCVQFIQEEEDCCNLGGSCKGWPNCYYKQLARKTQECENLKAEEKYLKQCCQKAGEELAKHSFEYDGKEKNLVVQAKQLNEKYEKAINALDQIQHLVTKCKDEECNKCDLRYEYCTPIMKDKILKLAKEGMYDNSSNLN